LGLKGQTETGWHGNKKKKRGKEVTMGGGWGLKDEIQGGQMPSGFEKVPQGEGAQQRGGGRKRISEKNCEKNQRAGEREKPPVTKGNARKKYRGTHCPA